MFGTKRSPKLSSSGLISHNLRISEPSICTMKDWRVRLRGEKDKRVVPDPPEMDLSDVTCEGTNFVVAGQSPSSLDSFSSFSSSSDSFCFFFSPDFFMLFLSVLLLLLLLSSLLCISAVPKLRLLLRL